MSVINGSYKKHVIKHTDLQEYCKTGLMTRQNIYIKYFLQSTDKKEEIIFNQICPQGITNIFIVMETAVQHADSNLKSSFWYNVMEFLSSGLFAHLVTLLPAQMRNRKFLAVVYICSAEMFEVRMHKSAAKDKPIEALIGYSTLYIHTEIPHFVGWAIKSRTENVDTEILAPRKKQKNLSIW